MAFFVFALCVLRHNDQTQFWFEFAVMIHTRYVLFNGITLLKTQDGRVLCDPFWAKELARHLEYIRDLHLCCPVIEADANADFKQIAKKISYNFGELSDISQFPLTIIPLKFTEGWVAVFQNFLPNFLRVKRALTPNCIAHSDFAAWPFPLSFYLWPLKFFMPFTWVTVLESTFFRMNRGEPFNFRKFISHHLHHLLIPLCLKKANARLFTHQQYKNLFFKNSNEHVYIFQYSMIDDEFFTHEEQIAQRMNNLAQRKMRFIMAGRLIPEKGVMLLLQAIEKLAERNIEAEISVMGSGPLEAACRALAEKMQGSINFSFIDPVPYGMPFYQLIRQYDFLLLPNLSEEQPRIVFDAFGQGLSIIASDTEGLKASCSHLENAVLFKRGDVDSFCDAITFAATNKEKVREFGIHGLRYAKSKTHKKMHQDREYFLKHVIGVN